MTLAVICAVSAPTRAKADADVNAPGFKKCAAACNAKFEGCLRRHASDIGQCCEIPGGCLAACFGNSEDTPDHATIASYIHSFGRCMM